ncbi:MULTISPECIES: hypothetical protein [Halobacteriales]|jgi:hypothetical protein|uniref:hypothetical protein n=1 Tax=Halobacteriales TaxID=2235 RepID=UPI0006791041|nr:MULTISPECIES: hypothetical protein [Halobacteria]MDT3436817.1 hypothetical protein [Haloarcula sp. 1CSR25-25]
MSSNDGDDELEERKSDVWSMDEVRGGGTKTKDTEDTSDTADEESASITSNTAEDSDAPDTSDASDTSEMEDTSDDESSSTTSDVEDAEDTADTSDIPDTADEIDDTAMQAEGETVRKMALDADAKGLVVRDLHNVNVYLYESVYQEMRVKYKELDTEYFAAHGEDLSKNKDFFNAVFRAGLQSPQLKEELEID